MIADSISPFYNGQRVINPRHPLWPPVTVTSVYEVAPRTWRFDWEFKPCAEASAVTGSAPASGYVRAGGGL